MSRHVITSHHMSSHHMSSHHMSSHHMSSHHMSAHHISSHLIISHHITSHHITSHKLFTEIYLPTFHFVCQFGIILKWSNILYDHMSDMWCDAMIRSAISCYVQLDRDMDFSLHGALRCVQSIFLDQVLHALHRRLLQRSPRYKLLVWSRQVPLLPSFYPRLAFLSRHFNLVLFLP